MSTAVVTVMKMIESLPESVQDRVVEHLREYLEEVQDELEWDQWLRETQLQLLAARQARKEFSDGQAQPMDFDLL